MPGLKPCFLKGEQIHIYGRITAIADVFDALDSDRVYKKAWELDRILNLFKEERGELAELPKMLKVREEYSDIALEEKADFNIEV